MLVGRVLVVCLLLLALGRTVASSQTQVRAWGSQNLAYYVPLTATGVVQIDCGTTFALALKANGKVQAWGNNAAAIAVPADLGVVKQVSAGSDHAVALLADGSVRAWGNNTTGQTNVPVGLSEVASIAAGSAHTLALRGDGTVVAWGSNTKGQSTVPAGLSNVVAVAAGTAHSLAVLADGSVIAWGWNTAGQCNVPAGLTDVVKVAAGIEFSVALLANGTIVAWGSNSSGQTTVPPGLSQVSDIAAGFAFTVALKADGTVVCWGADSSGQTSPPADLRQVCAIGAGAGLAFAIENTTNHPPIARAGADQTVQAVGTKASITLDGSQTIELDSNDALTFTWKEGTTTVGTGESLTLNVLLGRHFYELVVDDGNGGRSSDFVIVEVIAPPVAKLSATMQSGLPERLYVTLPNTAPPGGTQVKLASSSSVVLVPATVMVPEGQKVAVINAEAANLDSDKVATVRATVAGLTVGEIDVRVVVGALARAELPAEGTVSGDAVLGKVILTGEAGPGGAIVDLETSQPTISSVPASTTVAAGQRSKTFSIGTTGQDTPMVVTITARYRGTTRTADLTIRTAYIRGISIFSISVTGGTTVNSNQVRLKGRAGASGLNVALFSSDPTVAEVPGSVMVAPLGVIANFAIHTKPVAFEKTVYIFAIAGGETVYGSLTVTP